MHVVDERTPLSRLRKIHDNVNERHGKHALLIVQPSDEPLVVHPLRQDDDVADFERQLAFLPVKIKCTYTMGSRRGIACLENSVSNVLDGRA